MENTEQGQIAEEAWCSRISVHVTDGIDGDECVATTMTTKSIIAVSGSMRNPSSMEKSPIA